MAFYFYFRYQSGRGEKPFYSLTWTVQFQHSHDTVYFAHCFPYTYTDLQVFNFCFSFNGL